MHHDYGHAMPVILRPPRSPHHLQDVRYGEVNVAPAHHTRTAIIELHTPCAHSHHHLMVVYTLDAGISVEEMIRQQAMLRGCEMAPLTRSLHLPPYWQDTRSVAAGGPVGQAWACSGQPRLFASKRGGQQADLVGASKNSVPLMMTRCAGVLTPQARVLVATKTCRQMHVFNLADESCMSTTSQ